MQRIDFNPFTERVTWQDIQRHAPIPAERYFAYSFELALISVAGYATGYAIAANNYPGFLIAVLAAVILMAVWMLVFRYLHNRWRLHCKVQLKKFAEVNNFTYEESASWSGTDAALTHRSRKELITPTDTNIVSGEYAGHSFRLGLYRAVFWSGGRDYPYYRVFLRIHLDRGVVPDSQKDYVAQESPVYVEYKGQYVYFYSPQWSFGMRNIVQSIPELFAHAARLIR